MNGSVSANQSKLCFSGFWAQVVNLDTQVIPRGR